MTIATLPATVSLSTQILRDGPITWLYGHIVHQAPSTAQRRRTTHSEMAAARNTVATGATRCASVALDPAIAATLPEPRLATQ